MSLIGGAEAQQGRADLEVLWVGEPTPAADELQKRGVRVVRVPADGCLAQVEARAPDLLVLSGAAAARATSIAAELRRLRSGASLPIVVVSSDAAPADDGFDGRAGIGLYLSPALAPAELAAKVHEQLHRLASMSSQFPIVTSWGEIEGRVAAAARRGSSGLLVTSEPVSAIAIGPDGHAVPSPDEVREALKRTKGDEPASMKFLEIPGHRFAVLDEIPTASAETPALSGASIVVVHPDPARGEALATALAGAGATTHALGVDAEALAAVSSLAPTLLVVAAAALTDASVAVLWEDARLASASWLVIDDARLGAMDASSVVGPAAALCATESLLRRRLGAGELFLGRIESFGPAGWLKQIGRCAKATVLVLKGARGRAELILADGKIKQAKFFEAGADDPPLEARGALQALLSMPFGQVLAGPRDVVTAYEAKLAEGGLIETAQPAPTPRAPEAPAERRTPTPYKPRPPEPRATKRRRSTPGAAAKVGAAAAPGASAKGRKSKSPEALAAPAEPATPGAPPKAELAKGETAPEAPAKGRASKAPETPAKGGAAKAPKTRAKGRASKAPEVPAKDRAATPPAEPEKASVAAEPPPPSAPTGPSSVGAPISTPAGPPLAPKSPPLKDLVKAAEDVRRSSTTDVEPALADAAPGPAPTSASKAAPAPEAPAAASKAAPAPEAPAAASKAAPASEAPAAASKAAPAPEAPASAPASAAAPSPGPAPSRSTPVPGHERSSDSPAIDPRGASAPRKPKTLPVLALLTAVGLFAGAVTVASRSDDRAEPRGPASAIEPSAALPAEPDMAFSEADEPPAEPSDSEPAAPEETPPEGAAAAGEQVDEVAEEVEADALLEAAKTARRERRYAEAERLLAQLLEQSPDHFEGAYEMGLTLVRMRRREEAHPWIQRAIELGSGSPLPWLLQGDAFLQDGKLRDARRSWSQCLAVRRGFKACEERLARWNGRQAQQR